VVEVAEVVAVTNLFNLLLRNQHQVVKMMQMLVRKIKVERVKVEIMKKKKQRKKKKKKNK
jgi:hypothetical protein